ncbi:hypothetical protein D3C80_786870 [compost metagenome]
MRHLSQFCNDRLTTDAFTEAKWQTIVRGFERTRVDHLTEINRFAIGIRQFNTDDIATRNDGDASRQCRHRTGNIISKTNDTGRLHTRCRFKFIERNDRAGANMNDLATHAKIFQHAFKKASTAFKHFLRDHIAFKRWRLLKQITRRKLIVAMHNDRLCPGEGLRLIKRNRRRCFRWNRSSNWRWLFYFFNNLFFDNIENHVGFDRFFNCRYDFFNLRCGRFNCWCCKCFNLNGNRFRYDRCFNLYLCYRRNNGPWRRFGDDWLRNRDNWSLFNFLLVPLDSAELRNDGFNRWNRTLWCLCDDSGNWLRRG